MPYQPTASDYEPVTPLRRARPFEEDEGARERPTPKAAAPTDYSEAARAEKSDDGGVRRASAEASATKQGAWPALRRGHAVSFAGLLLFTAFVYFRPYELVPALAPLSTGAFWIAVATLVVFIPAQLGLEGTLSARPRPHDCPSSRLRRSPPHTVAAKLPSPVRPHADSPAACE